MVLFWLLKMVMKNNPSVSPAASHLPLHRGGYNKVELPCHLPRSCAATPTLGRLELGGPPCGETWSELELRDQSHEREGVPL